MMLDTCIEDYSSDEALADWVPGESVDPEVAPELKDLIVIKFHAERTVVDFEERDNPHWKSDMQEQFDRPQDLELTDIEREHWEGEYAGVVKGKTQYRCQRIELNALAATPQNFIDFVEAKLELHGLTKNLVPPDDVVLDAANDAVRLAARQQARNAIEEMIDIESLLGRAVEEIDGLVDCATIQSSVSEWGIEAAPESWRDVTTREAEEQVRQHYERIETTVRKSLESL